MLKPTTDTALSWSLIGLCFAVAYSVLVAITYFTQLTVVRSNVEALAEGALRLIEFSPGSWVFALDMLGYSFLILATLAAAPVFRGNGLERWLVSGSSSTVSSSYRRCLHPR